MVRSTQHTMYMVDLEQHRSLGVNYKPLDNTTLNEKFNIFLTEKPKDATTYPTLGYYCLGIGGSVILEEEPDYTFNEHSPLDGALFNHIPFCMREVTLDLDEVEKSKYRLRVVEEINGKEYACYYAKPINSIAVKQLLYGIRTLIDNDGGQTPILSPLDLAAEPVLNPIPCARPHRRQGRGRPPSNPELRR